MTQSLIFVSVVDHEEQSQLLLRPLNSARPAQNTGQTRRKKDIVSLRTSSHILMQQMQQIVLALVIWVATVTSRGHPEKTFSKIIPRFSAKIFLKIAPALANHGHSRYELLHLNPRRQGHKDLCGRLFLKGELYCNERTQISEYPMTVYVWFLQKFSTDIWNAIWCNWI